MGGLGSGNWYRWDTQTTISEVHSVDIRYLKKRGSLRAGTVGSLSWSCGGEQSGNIRFMTHSNSLQLMYKHRQGGEDWVSRNENITFDWTACNYGGSRQWLLCSHCGKRVAVIYSLASGFLCRHCYKLPYGSQRESYIDRMTRKARKIRKKLNADVDLSVPIFHKPKGMHWQTFCRLVKEEQRTNALTEIAFEKKIMALTRLG